MNIDLSKVDAKIRKLERWKNALEEILADPEGRQFLGELIVSPNGDGDLSVSPAVTLEPMPARIVRRKGTKKSQLAAAIMDASEELKNPFGARDVVSLLVQKSFKFSRDPMVQVGVVLRQLVAEGKLKVMREKIGRVGRLYTKVLP